MTEWEIPGRRRTIVSPDFPTCKALSRESPTKKVGARRWFATGAVRMSARNKPSSVPFRGRIIHLGPLLPTTSCSLPGTQTERAAPHPLFGLAPGGVYRATSVTSGPVRSYRTLSPLPVPRTAIGGLLSVALSIALRRPDVIRHPALWSSDFPPATEVTGDPHSHAHVKDGSKAPARSRGRSGSNRRRGRIGTQSTVDARRSGSCPLSSAHAQPDL